MTFVRWRPKNPAGLFPRTAAERTRGFTQTVLSGTLIAAGFAHVAAMRRSGAPYFDLWALATKSPMDEGALRQLAAQHFPS